MAYTLADMKTLVDCRLHDVVVETATAFPFVNRLNVVEEVGDTGYVAVVQEDPAAEIRKPNIGKSSTAGAVIGKKTIPLIYADASYDVDEQLVSIGGKEKVLSVASAAAFRGAMGTLERLCFNSNDPDFIGLEQWVDPANVVDLQGTGQTTSIYCINFSGMNLHIGDGGNFEVGDIERVYTSDSESRKYWCFAQLVRWRCGLGVSNKKCLAVVKNISKDTPVDEGHIFDAIEHLGASFPVDAIFMSTTSARDLRIARTQKTLTGSYAAPIIEIGNGTPVYVSDFIPRVA